MAMKSWDGPFAVRRSCLRSERKAGVQPTQHALPLRRPHDQLNALAVVATGHDDGTLQAEAVGGFQIDCCPWYGRPGQWRRASRHTRPAGYAGPVIAQFANCDLFLIHSRKVFIVLKHGAAKCHEKPVTAV